MKQCTWIIIALIGFGLVSCGQEDTNVSVSISSSPFSLIPSSASSCLAKKVAEAAGDRPQKDIASSYFRIPNITISRKDSTRTLIVSLIKFSIPVAGGTTLEGSIGGEALAALDTDWYARTDKEAVLDAGDSTKTTDCEFYAGGFSMPENTVATGTLTMYGLERSATGDETPFTATTDISVQSF